MQRDSASYTLLVAAVLCVVCSVFVAGAAVGLRPKQEANKILDRKANVLVAAASRDEPGDDDAFTVNAVRNMSDQQITELFDRSVERELINLETGAATTLEEAGLDEDYDPRTAINNPKLSIEIPAEEDVAGIKRKAKYAYVYKVLGEGGRIEQIVLPIYGKGLWSTVYGFLAVKADGKTVSGVTFYEHGETPGLGGEVENTAWQGRWVDKSIYNEGGEVELGVIKGAVNLESPEAKYEIDGLSGATITSQGVTHMIEYWLGPHGFQPYLQSVSQNDPEDA